MKAAAGALLSAMLLCGCSDLPGKPAPGPEVPRPESVVDPHVLYKADCSGCHGADGMHGPANPLADPVYQAWVDDASFQRVIAQGERGSMMPAFAKSSGGDLTDGQIEALVRGMRADWKRSNPLAGVSAPPYAEDGKGVPGQGEHVYAIYCASCHGPSGGKVGSSGSVLEAPFLALMTPQTLRTTVVVGRPDLGMPDWRSDVPGKPLSPQDVSDVVAFLMAQRSPEPGPTRLSRESLAAGAKSPGGAR